MEQTKMQMIIKATKIQSDDKGDLIALRNIDNKLMSIKLLLSNDTKIALSQLNKISLLSDGDFAMLAKNFKDFKNE